MVDDDRYMSQSDAFSWYMERDPELRSTVVAVAWLNDVPDWMSLCRKIDRATSLAPAFRRRPCEPPVRLFTPRWANDPAFDLYWHLRRVAAPEPRTRDTVLEMARLGAMTGFDHTRPLWEFTLVEGLQGGQAALILKMHHSLTDGIGGVALAHLVLDDRPVPSDTGPEVAAPPGERFSGNRLMMEGIAQQASRVTGALVDILRRAPRAVSAAASHPATAVTETTATVASLARMLRPVRSTMSPLITHRGPGRTLAIIDVPLEDLKLAAKAGGGTLNDGFVAALAGGLRVYHEVHGATVGDLLMTIPISIRKPGDPPGGNRITLERLAIPAGVLNVNDRIAEIHRRCLKTRAEPAIAHTNAVATIMNMLPASVVGGMLKRVEFLASDVPGFNQAAYLCGSRITGFHSFGPTIGAALNATLFSYGPTCHIGITIDTHAVPDHEVLVECLRAGFAEVTRSLLATPSEGASTC
jgi:diacylglycerol O-acyltransferase / wax synthase